MPAPAPAEPTTKPGTKEKEKGPWTPPAPKVNPTPKA